jgi:predicted P-loop ATPase
MEKIPELKVPGIVRVNSATAAIREAGRAWGYRPSVEVLHEHLALLGDANAYHPALRWVDTPPADPDTVPAFDDLFSTLTLAPGADPGLSHRLLMRWCLQAAAALLHPEGLATEGVLVLAGPQGAGKTRWLARLCEGAPRGTFKKGLGLDPAVPDSVRVATGCWIAELGEIDSTFRHADVSRLKAFFSQETDEFRLPYRRDPEKFARRTVFAGTVNEPAYLHDPTGDRRYWTIPVEKCDFQHDLDVRAFWHAMLVLVRIGQASPFPKARESSHWWLTAQEAAALDIANGAHRESDPVREALDKHYQVDASAWTPQDNIRDTVRPDLVGEKGAVGVREMRQVCAALRRMGAAVKVNDGVRSWTLRPRSGARPSEITQADASRVLDA